MTLHKDLKIIAIIPARGGSKGIPRKNIKLLSDKPLIAYAIDTALKSQYIDNVFVSTDDEEIAEIARLYGPEVIFRPHALAEDHVPLDPVIYHALTAVESNKGIQYDYVVTIQPTSPLLQTTTLDKMIEKMIKGSYDTLISVKADNHLYWAKKEDRFTPLYKERKNRQYLDPIYRETGAVLITKRAVISESTRIGDNISLFELPEEEALDIDTYQDWTIAENLLKRRTIVFRVDGDHDIGLGHIYRALTLANRLIFHHDILFLMDKSRELGIQKVREYSYPITLFSDETELFAILSEIRPHIIINDILDTDTKYIQMLRSEGYFIVNFEDMGEGAEDAHIVINALYEKSYPSKNHFYGYMYECLRDEFYIFPRKIPESAVNTLLITFGGTDPNDLTRRTLQALEDLGLKKLMIKVILGKGYRPKEQLFDYISELTKKGFNITIKENIPLMAKEMSEADVVITSNGRTIYEVASIGTPCISISQNERESRHLFVHNSHGPLYLGIAYTVSSADIALAIHRLMNDYMLRKEMSEKLLKCDLKGNLDRVLNLILNKYREWEINEAS
ncbi:MAG: Cytidyltransferase, putative [Methanomicrobiales archaeon 53_19]|uniref:cytidylyltransferase domain-containing protein n=1 Tax=Methanocalculus sp. TaxID=2004547 RepID=UPI00074943A4|nr:glycosyltransferase [Methanocalculus sp.]KUK70522.1 MAG: Cytidyltransferase, putative [Methanocalculus sp. 52_23]KUL02970.1 MAG: Cytidyltransferase, putative [Methanomicrobiales archaeon 53_19]HIJ05695.1 UDP-2,4-diacetamido-2,4,6-trideoxy-beta-L-altropyranose hydrolase [Methanocalculus sp.]